MIIRYLAIEDYTKIWQQMLNFTNNRNSDTEDELWVLEHYPVFTQGKVGKAEHIFKTNDIPVVLSDRGGQITYHAPGQLIIYLLLDLNRLKIGVKKLVNIIEQSIIMLLQKYQIKARLIKQSPGVYVGNNKIASLGLRIKKGYSMHGLSLNIDMDLTPFTQIRPCGLDNIGVTQIKDLYPSVIFEKTAKQLTKILNEQLT